MKHLSPSSPPALQRRRLLAAALLLPGLSSAQQPPGALKFAVVPQSSPSDLLERWGPVLAWLSEHTGITLEFATAPDIPVFEERLAAGVYDLAYMNPYHFVEFSARPGYRALAREKGVRLEGIVVVRKDSPYRTLEELQGLTLAFPAPASFAATILVTDELQRRGIRVGRQFVKSHNSVYRAVAQGHYPAGGGVPHTLELVDPAIRDELRVLWRSRAFTSHAIATHPRISDAVRRKLWEAMRTMSQDPEGLRRLDGIGFKGFESAADQDWADVRQLRISPERSGIKR